ncbi:MAG: AAA family ATPase [Albidovulum sp.]|nr:AAA family ATPase [Albidovulum sp.]
MIIRSIGLQDFRGIASLDIPIDEKLTVMVGANGVGKTSVLDAISHLLMPLRLFGASARENDNHRDKTRSNSTDISLDRSKLFIRARIRAKNTDGETFERVVELTHNRTKNSPAFPYQDLIWPQEFTSSDHPLFVYYRQDRGFKLNSRSRDPNAISKISARRQSLSEDRCAISDLSEWWDERDIREARHVRDRDAGFRDPQLEALRKLVAEIDEFEGIEYDASSNPSGLYLKKSPGRRLHIGQLSSGERVYLVLLADLARRLQTIQPKKKLAEIPGIVLIDEIELNLHPKRQRQIIPTLTKVFKSCQFIVTTHSPQVLGEVKSDCVRILRRNWDHEIEFISYRSETYGRDSNDMLIKVLGAAERDVATKENLSELGKLIGKGEPEKARELLESLRSELGGDFVELDIAERRLKRREKASDN